MNDAPFISFSVPGNPVALKRHRTFKKGDLVGTYDPSKGDKKDFLSKSMGYKPAILLDEPLRVELSFYFYRPRSHYRTGKYSNILKKDAPTWHTKIPDSDNLIKFVCDSFNGVFWRDDSLICELYVTKTYSVNPSVNIQIFKLNEQQKT